MRRTYVYFIRGKQHEWAIKTELALDTADDMRADGIELNEVWYSMPEWVAYTGMGRAWMFFSDILHFRNPFAS
jgi:hypothetical protein